MSREVSKLVALREFERWVRNPDLDPRLGLAFAAGAVRIDENELALIALIKRIECDRARQAVASMNEGDELASKPKRHES